MKVAADTGYTKMYEGRQYNVFAGKNPVNHVGRLYNLMAGCIATAVATAVPDVTDAECVLVSEIGRPIADPCIVDVAISGHAAPEQVRPLVEEIVARETGRVPELTDALVQGRILVF